MKNKIQQQQNRGLFLLIVTIFSFSSFTVFAQTDSLFAQTDSLAIEKMRAESGVDPTRVTSKVGFIAAYYDKPDNSSYIVNKFNVTLGVDRWSIALKPEIKSVLNGGSGFKTGISDMKFLILNAFYINGKHSMAGSVEFNIPFGKQDFGSQYFSATPAITYSYTLNDQLFFAIQPQYTFAIAKNDLYPDLRVLTTRIFLAKFTNSGYYFVFEPRSVYNFENKNYDMILSPIIGKALGAGMNLVFLMEIPTKKSTIDSNGILVQLGYNKNF